MQKSIVPLNFRDSALLSYSLVMFLISLYTARVSKSCTRILVSVGYSEKMSSVLNRCHRLFQGSELAILSTSLLQPWHVGPSSRVARLSYTVSDALPPICRSRTQIRRSNVAKIRRQTTERLAILRRPLGLGLRK